MTAKTVLAAKAREEPLGSQPGLRAELDGVWAPAWATYSEGLVWLKVEGSMAFARP